MIQVYIFVFRSRWLLLQLICPFAVELVVNFDSDILLVRWQGVPNSTTDCRELLAVVCLGLNLGMAAATNPMEPSMRYISYQWVLQLPVMQKDAFFFRIECLGFWPWQNSLCSSETTLLSTAPALLFLSRDVTKKFCALLCLN